MTAIRYSLHNLIEVVVDKRVHDIIIKAIDFQLGYFKTTRNLLHAPCRIVVKPYSDFSIYLTRSYHSLHPPRGIVGQWLDDPENRLSIVKEKRGYKIYVDRTYFPINLFIQLLLVEHGISLISAAAVTDVNCRVTLLPGAGGAGKTSLSLEMVKYHNYLLLGDDTVCLSEQGGCLSFPRNFRLKEAYGSTYEEVFERLRHIDHIKTGASVKATVLNILRFMRNSAPSLGLLNGILGRLNRKDLQAKFILSAPKQQKCPRLVTPPTVPMDEIVGSAKIADRGCLERIVYLERYTGNKFKVESISEGSLFRRAIATIHNEWALDMRMFFTMGAMEIVDIPWYFDRVAAIIRSGISKIRGDLLLIPDNATPAELSEYFCHYFDNS